MQSRQRLCAEVLARLSQIGYGAVHFWKILDRCLKLCWCTHKAVSLVLVCSWGWERLMRAAENVGELALPDVVALPKVLSLLFRRRGFVCFRDVGAGDVPP